MNFDLEDLMPFFRQLAAKWDGLNLSDLHAVLSDVQTMSAGDEKEWRFFVRGHGRDIPLVVRIGLDDYDSADLYLFSTADVAIQMQAELETFSENLGK